MIFAPEAAVEQAHGALAPLDEPRDVNPLDPDDENRYFNYDAWRDEQDAELAFAAQLEHWLEWEYDYFDPQLTEW